MMIKPWFNFIPLTIEPLNLQWKKSFSGFCRLLMPPSCSHLRQIGLDSSRCRVELKQRLTIYSHQTGRAGVNIKTWLFVGDDCAVARLMLCFLSSNYKRNIEHGGKNRVLQCHPWCRLLQCCSVIELHKMQARTFSRLNWCFCWGVLSSNKNN